MGTPEAGAGSITEARRYRGFDPDGICSDELMAQALDGTKIPVQGLTVKKIEEDVMDRMTRCAKCGKRRVPVITISGRTDLQCISCDDPAVKWADSPAAEKPIVLERA